MKARDVMTPNVVSVPADLSVPEVAKIMLDRRISAVPVVDPSEHVVGVISEGDLIRQLFLQIVLKPQPKNLQKILFHHQ